MIAGSIPASPIKEMKILRYPDPRLTAKNAGIPAWTPEVAIKVEEMVTLMAVSGGVGLAAPQVGWNVRLFVMSIPTEHGGDGQVITVLNPVVELMGLKVPMSEGCLSFPGIGADIERYTSVRLMGETPEGRLDRNFEDLAAQTIQHEIDHLDGILFIERMTPADRRIAEPILERMRLEAE